MVREGRQTIAKTRDIARQTEVDDNDEHEHNKGGKVMTSDNDDLIKRRVEERGKKWLWWRYKSVN